MSRFSWWFYWVCFRIRTSILRISLWFLWTWVASIYWLDYSSIIYTCQISKYIKNDIIRFIWILANKLLSLTKYKSNSFFKLLKLSFCYNMTDNFNADLNSKNIESTSFNSFLENLINNTFHLICLNLRTMHLLEKIVHILHRQLLTVSHLHYQCWKIDSTIYITMSEKKYYYIYQML